MKAIRIYINIHPFNGLNKMKLKNRKKKMRVMMMMININLKNNFMIVIGRI